MSGEGSSFESRVLMHGHTGVPTHLKVKQFNTALENALANYGAVHLAAGSQHCLALTCTGQVLSWGVGRLGQCGHGDQNDCPLPVPIRALEREKVVYLAAGNYTSACVTHSGKVFVWGYVQYGLLGPNEGTNVADGPLDQFDDPEQGSRRLQLVPTELTALADKGIRVVVLGEGHLVALTKAGQVYTLGLNLHGQCGIVHRDVLCVRRPMLARFPKKVRMVSIAAGRNHSLALDSEGTVWSWGLGMWGALGHGSSEDVWEPMAVAALRGRTVVNIGCGDFHSAAVLSDGTLYTWGKGGHNRLGLGLGPEGKYRDELLPRQVDCIKPHQAMTVKAGHWHTTVLTRSRHLLSFGSNYRDQTTAEHISKGIVSLYQLWPRRGEYAEADCPAPLSWVPITLACGEELTVYVVAPEAAVERQPVALQPQTLSLSHFWRNDIIPHWAAVGQSRAVRSLCLQGVPEEVRGMVWRLAIGNAMHTTREIYETLCDMAQEQVAQSLERELKRRQAARERMENGEREGERGGGEKEEGWEPQAVTDLKLIGLDLPRTQVKGLLDNVSINELRAVLVAFALNTPDLGYVQGMAFVVSNLLAKMDAFGSFVCLSNLVRRPVLNAFYHMEPEEMQTYYGIHQMLCLKYAPRIYAHWDTLMVLPEMYLVEWVLTLFTNTLPQHTVSRVWDRILVFGDYYIFVVAVAIVQVLQQRLVGASLEANLAALKRPLDGADSEAALFSFCDNVRLTQERFEEMKVTVADRCFSIASF